jgi:hypothetical protein
MCLSILLEDETGVPEENHDLHEVIDKLYLIFENMGKL